MISLRSISPIFAPSFSIFSFVSPRSILSRCLRDEAMRVHRPPLLLKHERGMICLSPPLRWGHARCLCKMYPEMDEGVNTTSQTLIMGVAPSKGTPSFEAAAETGAENGGCKCGPNCTCNPCTCK
uniref:Metallothionein-like protein n=1 Tax=Aegilops tauschii subsp. strangulata TaxID=200361 RepID=A0A453DZD1_AEGTS